MTDRMKSRPLKTKFYQQDTIDVAEQLLGKVLCRELDGKILRGKIVETEAYLGIEDCNCHTFGGRRTPRVETMYLPAGHAYVYLSHGLHWCLNVVTGDRDVPEAVLIRAVEPLDEIQTMMANRKTEDLYNVAAGPGRLTQALSINQSLDGHWLQDHPLWIEDHGWSVEKGTSFRIGMNETRPSAWFPLRFFALNSRFPTRHPWNQLP